MFLSEAAESNPEVLEEKKAFCTVCNSAVDSDSYVLGECRHKFHKKCLEKNIDEQVKVKLQDLQCHTCSTKISPIELKELLYDKGLYFGVDRDDIMVCDSPGCNQVIRLSEHAGPFYSCPGCMKEYCLKCRCEFHTEMTCRQYQSRIQVSLTAELCRKRSSMLKSEKPNQVHSVKVWHQLKRWCIRL
eukprot:TRINITY_DN16986_c0_g1_i4.p1 TRINITY_DN16986_c0_g1~~TRINITY_DN16986_c0_g1_i4.p1  ORF type:complete len:187 (-),score=12.10 TRINITY_DN16986_c0_g1_i4:247-807(-)